MMLMIRRISLCLLLSAFALIIKAQDDFGIWFAANGELGIKKKLDLKFSGSIRTFDNTSRIEQSFFETGLQYKFAKNFSVEGFYRFISNIEDDNNYHSRHRLALDFNASIPVSSFSIFTRIRMQRMIKTYIENDDDLLPVYAGRVKLGVEYRLSGPPLKPYIYFESYTPLSPDPGTLIDKYRLSAGTEVKITRRISADAGYIFQRDFQPDLSNIHIFSLEVDFKF
jgi:hypothetical protein